MSADPPAATRTEPAKQPRQKPLEPALGLTDVVVHSSRIRQSAMMCSKAPPSGLAASRDYPAPAALLQPLSAVDVPRSPSHRPAAAPGERPS